MQSLTAICTCFAHVLDLQCPTVLFELTTVVRAGAAPTFFLCLQTGELDVATSGVKDTVHTLVTAATYGCGIPSSVGRQAFNSRAGKQWPALQRHIWLQNKQD
jgi:hypothetical protein